MNIVVTGSIAFDYLMSFPGKFTEHFLPEHMSPRQPELPRRHDGQAARRLRAEHRLHAGAARRAAAADGDGRAGFRRLPPVARGGRRRHVAGAAGRRASSPRRSSAAPTREQPDRLVLHRRDGQCRRAVVPRRRRTAASRSSRRTIPGAMVQYAEECRTLGIPFIWDPGQQCARMSGDELRDGIVGRGHRHLQRLRVRADPAEDRAWTRRRSSRTAAR